MCVCVSIERVRMHLLRVYVCMCLYVLCAGGVRFAPEQKLDTRARPSTDVPVVRYPRFEMSIRLYQGSIKALSRIYQGSIKALSRLYQGCTKALEQGLGERCACRPFYFFGLLGLMQFTWC